VYLKGLNVDGLNGGGLYGIDFVSGQRLVVDHCVVRHFAGYGINIAPTAGPMTFEIRDTVLSDNQYGFVVDSSFTYLLAAVMLGVGYGLTYSVINGLAANEAPTGTTAQALLLFSLSYFIGVFGFPLLAGKIIVEHGMATLLFAVLLIAALNWLITVGRLLWRRTTRAKALQQA